MVSGDGIYSEEVKRVVEVDNDPPAANLIFRTGLSVEAYGIPISETYVNTFLEVRTEIRNDGDMAASNLAISLYEDGARKDEMVLPSIDSGDIVEVVLYWNPTTIGEKTVLVSLDPANTIEELDETDNDQSISFPVIQRPQGVDLAFRDGAIRTEPPIPRPNDQFLITARVDNLGSTDATSVEASLEIHNGLGWVLVSSTAIPLVMGQGASQISFAHKMNQSGPVDVRITVTGTGLADLDWSNNQVESTVLVDESTLTGSRSMTFGTGEIPIRLIDLDDEGLVITEKEGVLSLYRLNSNRMLTSCTNVLDEMWSGDLAFSSTEDGWAHIVWTRRFIDSTGYFRQTLSYSTIDASCEMTPIQDLMQPILLSDGKYWGIDIDVDDSEILVSGYHREMMSGSSFGEQTSVFILHADAPTKSSDWSLTPNVVDEIDLIPGETTSLEVEFGDDDGAHLLYKSTRSDSTNIERHGLWYAHGLIEQSSWTFRKSVADDVTLAKMMVFVIDDEERIVATWKQGEGLDAEMVAIIADSSFNEIDNLTATFPARGMSAIDLVETSRGVQVLFDLVGPTGPQVNYGIIDPEEGWFGIYDRLNLGNLYLVDRSPSSSETIFIHTSASGWQIRAVIDDNDPNRVGDSILDILRHQLGLDEQNFNILLGGFAIAVLLLCTVILVTLSARGLRWIRRSRSVASGVVILEEDVVDVVDESDIKVVAEIRPEDSEEVELVDEVVTPTPVQDMSTPVIPLPEVPVPEEESASALPAPPPMNMPVICPSCSSRFEIAMGNSSVNCPVCNERIVL